MVTIGDLKIIIDIARRAPMLPAEANWLEIQAKSIDQTLIAQAKAKADAEAQAKADAEAAQKQEGEQAPAPSI